MEALSCGTPVVALRSPALEELIDDGRTGFLVRDVEEMRRAFEEVHRLSPADCRRAAEEKCSGEVMTAAYLRLYADLAGDHALASTTFACSARRL
jgi:glycosyltransferase involved in cell wall biosynthesis